MSDKPRRLDDIEEEFADFWEMQEVTAEEDSKQYYTKSVRNAEDIIDVEAKYLPEKHSERFIQESSGSQKTLPKIPSAKVMLAYQDYFDLGAGRTIAELQRGYAKTAELYGRTSVPTTSLQTLYTWKKNYDWDIQVRADELDLYEERMESKRESARKIIERQTGYSKVMQTLGFNFLRSMLDEHGQLTERGLSMLSPSEARKFLTEGGRMEIDLYGGEANLEDDDEIRFE